MIRFILYAVLAYFVYQLAMSIDWNHAGNKAVNQVEHTATDAVDDARDSSVGQILGDSFEAIKDLVGW